MSKYLGEQLTEESLWEDYKTAKFEGSPAMVRASILHAKSLGLEDLVVEMESDWKDEVKNDAWRMNSEKN